MHNPCCLHQRQVKTLNSIKRQVKGNIQFQYYEQLCRCQVILSEGQMMYPHNFVIFSNQSEVLRLDGDLPERLVPSCRHLSVAPSCHDSSPGYKVRASQRGLAMKVCYAGAPHPLVNTQQPRDRGGGGGVCRVQVKAAPKLGRLISF